MNYASPPRQPTRTKASQPSSSRSAGLIWFVVFTTVGAGALAAGVLLPDWAALAQLEGQRDALAHHVRCESDLARYNDRLIEGIQEDPVLTARLMIRHANYRPAGCREIDVDSSLLPDAPPERIMHEAHRPPAPPGGVLFRAGQWVRHGPTRSGLVLLGLASLCLGTILFVGLPRRRDAACGAGPQRPAHAPAMRPAGATAANGDEAALIHPVVIPMHRSVAAAGEAVRRRHVTAASGECRPT